MATLIGQRTIDAIPESECHGRAWHLLPLWLSLNATVMAATNTPVVVDTAPAAVAAPAAVTA